MWWKNIRRLMRSRCCVHVCVSPTNNFFVYSLPNSCHLLWLHSSGFHTSRHISCKSCCTHAVVLLTCVCRCRGQLSTGVADSNSVRDMNICTRFLCYLFMAYDFLLSPTACINVIVKMRDYGYQKVQIQWCIVQGMYLLLYSNSFSG